MFADSKESNGMSNGRLWSGNYTLEKQTPAVPDECLKGHYSAEKLFWFMEIRHHVGLLKSLVL